MGLTATLIAVMSQVFIATLGLRLESEHTTSVQQDGRFIMARLRYDVRRSTSIVSPPLGVASSSMVLVIPEEGSDQTYQYLWNGSDLTVTTATSSYALHSNRSIVTDFSVTPMGSFGQGSTHSGLITVTLGLAGNTDVEPGQQALELHTTIGQR